MYQFFVDEGQIQGRTVTVTGGDVNHIRNVLRMGPGDGISVLNGADQKEYRCRIVTVEEDRVICEVCSVEEKDTELSSRICLFQGLPKGDKMELIVQKAVELGACEIIPVAAKRCVVKLEEKKAAAKVLRWQAVAEAAAKQSKRRIVPKVGGVMSFREAVSRAAGMDVKLIPYELAEGMERTRALMEEIRPGQEIALFIGPEGGFEESEIALALQAGIEPVTLGRRILRTETAGLAALSWMMYFLEGRAL